MAMPSLCHTRRGRYELGENETVPGQGPMELLVTYVERGRDHELVGPSVFQTFLDCLTHYRGCVVGGRDGG